MWLMRAAGACHLLLHRHQRRFAVPRLMFQSYAKYKDITVAMGNSNSTVNDRATAAVIGCLVADAAASTTHWMYEVAELDQALADEGHKDNPEFLPKSHCPYYRIGTGMNSCYGDQTYAVLKSLVESKGFNKEHYKKTLFDIFGPESFYHYHGYEAVPKEELPAQGPWRNGSIRAYLEAYNAKSEKTGKDDSMGDCYAKVAPIVALYAGKPELAKVVEEVVRVTQENDLAVKAALAAAYILEEIVLHGGSPNVVSKVKGKMDPEIAAKIELAMARKGDEHRAAVADYGLSCALPGSLQGSIHCLAKSTGVYTDAVRMTMTGGGDNCPRVAFVGACTAAGARVAGLPKDWIEKAVKGKEIAGLAEKLAALR